MTYLQAMIQDAFILALSVLGLVFVYEKYVIPARLKAERLHVLYQCTQMSGVDCAKMIPTVFKCKD